MAYLLGFVLIVTSVFLMRGHYIRLKTLLKNSDRPKWAIVIDEFLLGPSFIYLLIGLVGVIFLFRGRMD